MPYYNRVNDRTRASRLHLWAFALTAGLVVAARAWRGGEGLVRHHARQSTLLLLLVHLLAAVHALLHLAAGAALRVARYAASDLEAEVPGWTLTVLSAMPNINLFVFGGELLVGLVLAVYASRRAAAGERYEHFFTRA